jgi:hypothetical protein
MFCFVFLSFGLEIHLVHWKTSYGTVIDAKGHPDGLAVLSVLFQVDDQSAEAEEEPIEVPFQSVLT